MRLPLKRAAAFAVVLSAFGVASAGAQENEPLVLEVSDLTNMPFPASLAAIGSPAMSFVASEVGTSRVVKGAPYTAEAVSESTQVLMDGNRIQRRAAQRLARDGEGRTRVERLKRDGTVESVMINDVVAGKRYWLLPERKRVIELPGTGSRVSKMRIAPVPGTPEPPAPPAPPAPPQSMSGDEARSWAEEMRQWAREFRSRWRAEEAGADGETRVIDGPDGNSRVIIKQATSPGDDGRSMEVDVVKVIESANDAAEGANAIIAAIPPVPLGGPAGQGVTTALGSKELDNVRADGSRTTWTIPAGRIGNEKPIDVISERWYSPELLIVVSSRYLDPRRGETTYRLTQLKRGEPDASLFQVPADYERKPARVGRHERGRN